MFRASEETMEEQVMLILNGISGTPGVIRTPDPLLRRKTPVFHSFYPAPYFPTIYINSGDLLSL